MPRRSEPTQTAGDWQTALADAAQRTKDIRRDAIISDVSRWREVCQGIATGREPDGRTLAEVADIADRLSLPHNALAEDVAALVEHSRLNERLAKKRAEREALDAQAPELKVALDVAKKEVERITLLLRRIDSLTSSEISAELSVGKLKADNPRLFQPHEKVADATILERSRLSGQGVTK